MTFLITCNTRYRVNKLNHHILVLSGFASSTSMFEYSRMKGDLENAVRKLNFPNLTILNTPTLPRKTSDRAAEGVGVKTIQLHTDYEGRIIFK